jgi:hypothetical protein
MISGDGLTASVPTNAFTSFMAGVETFNINHVTMVGSIASVVMGMLVDNGSLNIGSSGTNTLTILSTEMDLDLGSFGAFAGRFTGIVSHATVTRSFYIDPTNSGTATDWG